jgi:CubicO group peptidase (beta-lactamase class C family)
VDFAFEEPIPGERNRRTRAVVVVYDGMLIAEGYAEEDGFHQDTRQVGWSMTKSVTNALVGILVGQGELNLYEPAPVPEWSSPGDPRSAITLDDLLRMTSGLNFFEEVEVLLMIYGSDDSGGYAANKRMLADSGTRWAYSSGTSNIIARAMKAEFDRLEDYFAFPRRALFDRLGMRSAIIEPDGSGTLVGSSYMWATPRDWARFGLLYLNDGIWEGERILPEGWIEYTTTPTAPSDGKYGAHFWVNAANSPYPNLPADLYECRGWLGQKVTIIPSKKLVVVRLGFNPNINYGSNGYHEPQYWSNDYHEAFVLKCLGAIEYP